MESGNHNLNNLDLKRLPLHVGIIMDGNGRWAQKKNKARTQGHLEGLSAAKRVVKTASDLGIKYLSLYTFSTENWKRAEQEVNYLMFLIKSYLKREYKFYKKNNIKVMYSGDISYLSKDVAKIITSVMHDTNSFTGLNLNLAINYGGRDEIVRSFNRWLNKNQNSRLFMEDELKQNLDLPHFPDVDLIIRTGGEKRVSNFLLWESAYAELYFSDKYWPVWDKANLVEALIDYQSRKRRFGSIK